MKHGNHVLQRKYHAHIHNRIGSALFLLMIFGMTGLSVLQDVSQSIPLISDSPWKIIAFFIGEISQSYGLVLFLIIAIVYFGNHNFTYLQVTAEGLIYNNLFYKISVQWHQIHDIYRPFYKKLKMTFIDEDHDEWLRLLQSSCQSYIEPLSWFLRVSGLSTRIPISEFAWNWRSSELGIYILMKVPRLSGEVAINEITYNE
jgi:hypothetical protein